MKNIIISATFLLVLSGCKMDTIGLRYVVWRQDLRNQSHNKDYRNAVGDQAQDEALIGTWTRTYSLVTKKMFAHKSNTQTLSLFKDGTYALRQEVTGFLLSLRTTEGTWEKDADGLIQLVPEDEDAKTTSVDLSRWTNAFTDAQQQLLGTSDTRYASSVLLDANGLPIVVFHQCTQEDTEGFPQENDLSKREFLGSFIPDAKLVMQADETLREQLGKEKPGKSYLRQYGGFHCSSSVFMPNKRYLWIQLTTADAFEDEPALGGFGWPGYLDGFHKVWDGGDDYGHAIYDIASGKIIALVFNGEV